MIHLTRLNGQPVAVNSDLIKFVERSPDTVITLITGEKLVVRESTQDVLERIVEFRRSVFASLSLGGTDAAACVSQRNPNPTDE